MTLFTRITDGKCSICGKEGRVGEIETLCRQPVGWVVTIITMMMYICLPCLAEAMKELKGKGG